MLACSQSIIDKGRNRKLSVFVKFIKENFLQEKDLLFETQRKHYLSKSFPLQN